MLTEWLNQFKQDRQTCLLDIHLANFLVNKAELNDDLMNKRFGFLVLSLSIEVRAGHVCLDLTRFNQRHIGENIWLELGEPTVDDWYEFINFAEKKQVISDGSLLSPLIFIHNKLYFQRMWIDEKQVAYYFAHNTVFVPKITTILDQLFNQTHLDVDWQKVAVAVALTRKVSIISGGPGTGKTTTVTKILASLMLTQPKSRIIAAAPTGKAASRLAESLRKAINDLSFETLNIPTEVVTLHRLLGARADNQIFLYNKNNKLNIDVLLIDEASMIDLNMMARVIEAIPESTRLILLGDKDQLSSVEAGAVFGDLCEFITAGYSQDRAKQLTDLTGYNIASRQIEPSIADSICLLQKSYRFDENSGIGELAKAIKYGQYQEVKKLLSNDSLTDIQHYRLDSTQVYQTVLSDSVNHYQHYLKAIKKQEPNDIQAILQKFSLYRLLCAVREGSFGVEGLNKQLETLLIEKNLIRLKNREAWYIGRPIMILRNSSSLGLYNGDIGITLPAEHDKSKLRVYFLFADGSIKGFSPFRLPEHETAYVMTIHKSQGSEFDDVNIILPTESSPLLNRSLLYTAVTRAKKTVSIYATDTILAQTVKTQTERQSGLVDLLQLAD